MDRGIDPGCCVVQMSLLLDGKTAMVTGGARGLGRAIIEEFRANGARGLSFDLESGDTDLPEGWGAVAGDVCSEADLAAAYQRCVDEHGGLDVVVANAGVVPPWRETADLDMDEWTEVFDINVRGVAATIKHAVPLMQDCGGSIIVMGSLNSHRGHARQCLYTASKHAVLGIVRAVARDLGRYGIRVNALGPGPIATEALVDRVTRRAAEGHPAPDEVFQAFATETPLERMASACDVARAAVFLASAQSDGISGQLLPVDAGLT
jgi:NAD(P)-dependent dehydrogenase (short-subunit alcohol dehydrogenase family)